MFSDDSASGLGNFKCKFQLISVRVLNYGKHEGTLFVAVLIILPRTQNG